MWVFDFQMDFTKSKVSLKNWVSKNVRVANIQATIVLRCSNEPVLKADSKSVRISEISQQMPEIPTFFFPQKEEKKSRKCFLQVSWFRVRIQLIFRKIFKASRALRQKVAKNCLVFSKKKITGIANFLWKSNFSRLHLSILAKT